MNTEHPARSAAERTLDTLKYFFEAALDDARTVLRTAQAIVRDREHSKPAEAPAAGKPKQPARPQPAQHAADRSAGARHPQALPARRERQGPRRRVRDVP